MAVCLPACLPACLPVVVDSSLSFVGHLSSISTITVVALSPSAARSTKIDRRRAPLWQGIESSRNDPLYQFPRPRFTIVDQE
ncbi:hypothetical protein IF1G_06642 [Cordyceps javanica]|uniref:Uncharacterized protein n=1 Tax=Cordyceps javanica TaxID=43265 RepID=A0A545UYS8_9HYPO|nr:hypothetical protein IF1G_06642 [Cordyceps javanica]